MPQKFIIKHSSNQGSTPAADYLLPGELALNSADGILYFKNAGAIGSIGAKVAATTLINGLVKLASSPFPAMVNVSSEISNNVITLGTLPIRYYDNGSWAYGFRNSAQPPLGSYSLNIQSKEANSTTCASGASSLAIGISNTASGASSLAIGISNTASGASSLAIGISNTTTGASSLAIGISNTATGSNSTLVGYNNVANKSQTSGASVFGAYNYAFGASSVAIGWSNNRNGEVSTDNGGYSTAVGIGNYSTGVNSLAIGLNNLAYAIESTAVGFSNNVSGNYASAFGWSNNRDVAASPPNLTTGQFSTALGYNNNSAGVTSLSVGAVNKSGGDYSTAIGYSNQSNGTSSAAIGAHNTSTAENSVAIGHRVTVGTINTMELGLWQGPVTRNAAIRLAADLTDSTKKYVSWTVGANVPSAAGTGRTVGNELTAELMIGGMMFTVDANDVLWVYYNRAGTIKKINVGTFTTL